MKDVSFLASKNFHKLTAINIIIYVHLLVSHSAFHPFRDRNSCAKRSVFLCSHNSYKSNFYKRIHSNVLNTVKNFKIRMINNNYGLEYEAKL